MRKRSGQVHSRESSATLQLTVSLLYRVNGRILHIVAGCDNINIYIITAYYPDTKKFEDDLKTRRKR